MPFEGPEKKDHNFVSFRIQGQEEFWPDFCKKWDEEQQDKRFRSEVLSLTELWRLYTGKLKEQLTAEEEARGKKLPKKEKISQIVPIKKRRILFTEETRVNEFEEVEGTGIFKYNVRFHDDGYLHFDQWLYVRDRARKELYWFGKEVCGMDFEPHVHQATCDLFVQKDFDRVYREGYTIKDVQRAIRKQDRVPRVWFNTSEYVPKTLGDFGHYVKDPMAAVNPDNYAKTMILLDPRGFFKSTTNGIDCVQWIINCPDIRILILSGGQKLLEQFLQNAKQRFYLARGDEPTKFHLLFPEFVIKGVDGTSDTELICPARNHYQPDPTLGVISIPSSLSGFHCDYIKFDDIVTDENCNTDDTRKKLEKKADGATNLLMPWGKQDIIGTRYFTDDYYGKMLEKHEENPDKFPLKFFKRACWVVKPEFKEVEQTGLLNLKEYMVDLTFPEHEPWKDLVSYLSKDEKGFRCQKLNEPAWGTIDLPSFPEPLLRAHRIHSDAAWVLPSDMIVAALDTAREAKKNSDYTAIVIAKIYQKQNGIVSMVILHVEYGRWTQTDIAIQVAKQHNIWKPAKWVAEDTGGLELLRTKIINVARESFGLWPDINWFLPDNKENAKRNRIKGIEVLLRSDRLDFVEAAWNMETFQQFMDYTGQKSTKTKKDDIPDAISFLTSRFLPSSIPLTPKEQEAKAVADQVSYTRNLIKAQHERIFGINPGGSGVQFVFPTPEVPQAPSSAIGSIAKKLFGGNGMRAR